MSKINEMPPVRGFLHWVGEVKSGTTKKGDEYKTVDFVLTWKDGSYDRYALFNIWSVDNTNRIKRMPLGTELEVYFSIGAREWDGMWFGKNSVIGFKQIGGEKQNVQSPVTQNAVTESDNSDDLPF